MKSCLLTRKENEVKAARKENGASGTNYASDLEALEDTLHAYDKTLYEVQVQMADREYRVTDIAALSLSRVFKCPNGGLAGTDRQI